MHDAVAEIVEHHRFIEAWLQGSADPGGLEGFLERHTPDFTLCGPGGDTADRAGLAAGFGAGHGAAPSVSVEVREARVVAEDAGLVVAVYEEHQASPGASTARRSTAVFTREASARNGLRWKHLHESWIAAG
ncbi:DUF4440 domain-containing protein [Nocardiopsis coralliicola]